MADFGPARIERSKYLNTALLVYECNDNAGSYYLFKQKSSKRLSNGGVASYYECRGCVKAEEDGCVGNKKRVTVHDGRIVTDPNDGHLQLCQIVRKAELEVSFFFIADIAVLSLIYFDGQVIVMSSLIDSSEFFDRQYR